MRNQDIKQIADLYEEGLFDRFKASAAGIGGGLKGLVAGKGYAKSAQSAKFESLVQNHTKKLLEEIRKFEVEVGLASRGNRKAKSYLDKIKKLKAFFQPANIKALVD